MRPLHARPFTSLHTPLHSYHICSHVSLLPLSLFVLYAVEKRKAADSYVQPLMEEAYVTPRMRFIEKSKAAQASAAAAGAIAQGSKRGSRVAGFAAYFEQFNDALSA